MGQLFCLAQGHDLVVPGRWLQEKWEYECIVQRHSSIQTMEALTFILLWLERNHYVSMDKEPGQKQLVKVSEGLGKPVLKSVQRNQETIVIWQS